MGQLGELAKKTQKVPGKTYTIVGGGKPEDKQAEATRKEEERARTVAEARAKSQASMKGLQKSTSRK
jgi:hypothetical protein